MSLVKKLLETPNHVTLVLKKIPLDISGSPGSPRSPQQLVSGAWSDLELGACDTALHQDLPSPAWSPWVSSSCYLLLEVPETQTGGPSASRWAVKPSNSPFPIEGVKD